MATKVSTKTMPVKPAARAKAGVRPTDKTEQGKTSSGRADSTFAVIKQSRVFEQVCEEIRKRLAIGEYRPGDKLPPERELAGMLGVSRQALREALRMLENAGVLTLRKGAHGGAFIQQGNPEVIKQSMLDLVHLGHVSLRDVLEARAIITTSVLNLACERGSDADFDGIEASIHRAAEARQSNDVYETISVGTHFYRAIAAATHNEVLVILVNALSEILRYVLVPLGTGKNEQVWALRWKILGSMRARNKAKARRELHELFAILESIYSEREAQRAMVERQPSLKRTARTIDGG